MSSDPEAVVRGFFDECAKGGTLISAIDEHCTDDCVWENVGLPTAEGKEAMQGFMQGFIDNVGMHALVVELRGIAASGSTVLTERIDHLDDADGNHVMSLPVCGVLEVSGDRVCAWRDYFDPRPFIPED